MRSIWSGAISFGLVNIPVKIYSAVAQQEINFDMLDKKDMSPIRYARISKSSGKEVDYKDIVKGYEHQKGSYIVVTEKDFEKASPEKSKTIDILDFAKEEEIDSIYFEKPYYLEPDKGAAKAYTLLLKALQKSKKVAIAQFMIRNRERIGVLKPMGDIIILNQIRYHSEIKDHKDITIPKVDKLSNQEIEMALKLIDQLTREFKPEEYKDNYVESIKKVIEAKAKGKEIKAAPAKKSTKEVKDLMSVLKESLKANRKKAA